MPYFTVNVYNSIDNFPGSANAVVTIGTFDGVHIGHQQIIRNLRKLAAETHGETVLLTFFPHPRMVLQPDDNDLKLITTMVEREELLRSFGIDHLIIQPFDKEFSRISATEFVRDQLMQKIGMKTLVIGYDHHFGRNREGSYKDLEEMAPVYGFRLEEINEQVINHIAVSSTKVRKALLEGDIGRTLGFPTANIEIPEAYKLVPAEGIYAVQIRIGQQLKKGMLYIGTRPVVNGKSLRIEVNIFEFDQEIYNQEIQVMFVSRIRGDLPFTDINALKEKMKEDKVIATKLLS